MHREVKEPLYLRIARRMRRAIRRLTGAEEREQYETWCELMSREIAARPWPVTYA